ncbi:protein max-like [Acanthaster planci]|uniref:Protein max n=1 Tax=Acanthaster planci TaxID=133434 RepID=A0A8B7ZJV7_ACAPL|nr:protein max-like [Acanthaster planci]
MSDDEPDVGLESDAEKRAHHNALERKRRDHIKDSFNSLRDAVPNLEGEKASRAQILNKATEYIQFMRRKNNSHQSDIDGLKRQNQQLDQQIRLLEKNPSDPLALSNGLALLNNPKSTTVSSFERASDSDSDSSEDRARIPPKRLKTGDGPPPSESSSVPNVNKLPVNNKT